MELALLTPVLGRPHRVRPLIDSMLEATPSDAYFLFICDPGDEDELKAIEYAERRFGPKVCQHMIWDGNYASKINRGVKVTETPLLFFGADDLNFHPHWLERAKAKLDGKVGVVATNDMCNPRVADGTLATHPLVTREYTKRGAVDDETRVLHEGYPHEYVDREFSETAIFRGAFAYAPDSVVEHLHPGVGKAPLDGLYAQQRFRMKAGRRIYFTRSHLWDRPWTSQSR